MKCPYCGSVMQSSVAMPRLRPTRQRIYDATSAAGEAGIPAADLVDAMVDGKRHGVGANTTMRVQVHETNKIIAPFGQRIVGTLGTVRNGRYYLVARES